MITGPRETLKRARKLRSEATLPERLLWRELRKRPAGLKFRRQHPAGIYIIDFYCAAARLAIEVDGWGHDSADARQHDTLRSGFLRTQGVATLRVPARIILQDVEPAVARIVEACMSRINSGKGPRRVPLHHPADGSPPRAGEE